MVSGILSRWLTTASKSIVGQVAHFPSADYQCVCVMLQSMVCVVPGEKKVWGYKKAGEESSGAIGEGEGEE